MFSMLTAAPPAGAANGLLTAVAIALAVTALVAVGMTVAAKLKHVRISGLAVSIGAGSIIAVLVGALFVGGALTRPPAAAADTELVGKLAGHGPVESKVELEGFQLPTL
jgi:hypothetical protein